MDLFSMYRFVHLLMVAVLFPIILECVLIIPPEEWTAFEMDGNIHSKLGHDLPDYELISVNRRVKNGRLHLNFNAWGYTYNLELMPDPYYYPEYLLDKVVESANDMNLIFNDTQNRKVCIYIGMATSHKSPAVVHDCGKFLCEIWSENGKFVIEEIPDQFRYIDTKQNKATQQYIIYAARKSISAASSSQVAYLYNKEHMKHFIEFLQLIAPSKDSIPETLVKRLLSDKFLEDLNRCESSVDNPHTETSSKNLQTNKIQKTVAISDQQQNLTLPAKISTTYSTSQYFPSQFFKILNEQYSPDPKSRNPVLYHPQMQQNDRIYPPASLHQAYSYPWWMLAGYSFQCEDISKLKQVMHITTKQYYSMECGMLCVIIRPNHVHIISSRPNGTLCGEDKYCFGGKCMESSSHDSQTTDHGSGMKYAQWNEWGNWSECSALCNNGSQHRVRACEESNGKTCNGTAKEERVCEPKLEPCTKSGRKYGLLKNPKFRSDFEHGPWGEWEACSITCGSEGTELRERSCSPKRQSCIKWQSRKCVTVPSVCPEEPDMLTPWYDWMPCSVTCGFGVRKRARDCLSAHGCDDFLREYSSCRIHC